MSQQQPCLPVAKRRRRAGVEDAAGPIGFDDVQGMDASEYLSRVVRQASELPETFSSLSSNGDDEPVTRSRIRRERHVPIDGLGSSLAYLVSGRAAIQPPPSPAHLPADPEVWVDRTLETFSRLREYLERCANNGVGGKDADSRVPVPPMKDRPGWHIFAVGADGARGNEGSYFEDDGDEVAEPKNEENGSADGRQLQEEPQEPAWRKNLPLRGYSPDVSLLLQLDQVMVRRVLGHLSHYVRNGWSPANAQRSAWIYALLARLERPIHRDDASVLYGLLKSLCQFRGGMKLQSSEGDSVDVASARTDLARVNVLIAVIGIYFEQGGGFAGVMTVK